MQSKASASFMQDGVLLITGMDRDVAAENMDDMLTSNLAVKEEMWWDEQLLTCTPRHASTLWQQPRPLQSLHCLLHLHDCLQVFWVHSGSQCLRVA